MKLTVAGCSPAWPNPGGAQSGYLVESGGGRLLLDCGPGVLPRLRAAEGWPIIEAIVISHFHLDHWGDLVPWAWGLQFGPASGSPHPELWLPPGGRATLAASASRWGSRRCSRTPSSCTSTRTAPPFEVAGQRIVPHRVLHYDMLAFGFRVSANGSTLAYSADSGPTDALVSLARDADLFLCEATLQQPNPEGGIRGHLAADEADEAFRASGAKRLLLTHRPSERPLDERFEQAYDGLELEV